MTYFTNTHTTVLGLSRLSPTSKSESSPAPTVSTVTGLGTVETKSNEETPITNKPPSGGGFGFGSASLPGFGSSSTVSSQWLPTTGASTATQSVPFPFGSSGSSPIFGTSGSSFPTNASVMGSSVLPANPFGSGTTLPTFGQPLVSQSPPAFNFGSAAPSIAASPFHFLGQQNQATPQNLPSFQTSNSLVNSGGSFSLGFGAGDEGNQMMIRISKNKNRTK